MNTSKCFSPARIGLNRASIVSDVSIVQLFQIPNHGLCCQVVFLLTQFNAKQKGFEMELK